MSQSDLKAAMVLRDDQWEKLEPLLLSKGRDFRIHERNNRLFIDALLWYLSAGRAWTDLPEKFGKWNTVFMRMKRWSESGFWRELVEDLRDDCELCALIQKIEEHCEHRKTMAKKIADRKMAREIYKSSRI